MDPLGNDATDKEICEKIIEVTFTKLFYARLVQLIPLFREK